MKIEASIRQGRGGHLARVATGGAERTLEIPARADARGFAVNGGELLLLALATCYGNDVYREAARRAIPIEEIEVAAEADFQAEGAPATNVRYRVRVVSPAAEDEVAGLLRQTDTIAEIQNTVRVPVPVLLESIQVRRP